MPRWLAILISMMEPSAQPAAIPKFTDLIIAVASVTALDQQRTATKN
jgi:hypothetical protein